MARRKNTDAAVSRERILLTALERFAQRGYSASGVDDLAAAAGIAKTAIYYHFGSKEGLLAAVLERAANDWIEGIRSASLEGGTPPERLRRALVGMRAMLEERPWILRLVQILALEVADDKPQIRATIRGIIRKARATIVDGLRDSLDLEIADAELIAAMLLALFDGVAFGHDVDPELAPLDAVFEEIRRVVIFMIARRLHPELERFLDEAVAAGALPKPNDVTKPGGES
jgi:AcrR family transcriptional regulator